MIAVRAFVDVLVPKKGEVKEGDRGREGKGREGVLQVAGAR